MALRRHDMTPNSDFTRLWKIAFIAYASAIATLAVEASVEKSSPTHLLVVAVTVGMVLAAGVVSMPRPATPEKPRSLDSICLLSMVLMWCPLPAILMLQRNELTAWGLAWRTTLVAAAGAVGLASTISKLRRADR